MKLPIIIVESETCIDVFETVEKAECYLEPIDVINKEFVGYDGEGRLLDISVTGDEKKPMYHRKIIIKTGEEEPNHSSDLREVLTRFLSYLQLPKGWVSQASLKDLVTKAQKFKTE